VKQARPITRRCAPAPRWVAPPRRFGQDQAPMTRRDRQLLFALAGLTLALASLTLVGASSDVLLAVQVLVLVLPLLAGRYVGEEALARVASAFVARRRRPVPALVPVARLGPQRLPRGGRLIAASLAVRPPPPRPPLTA
jgi:hypothetical protein